MKFTPAFRSHITLGVCAHGSFLSAHTRLKLVEAVPSRSQDRMKSRIPS